MELLHYVYDVVFVSELSYLFYGFLVIAFGGYFLLAGGSFVYFYILKRNTWIQEKIQEDIPTTSDIWHEIKWSLSSTFIWIFFAMGIIVSVDQGWVKLYFDVAEHGRPYFLLSIVLLVLLHDTYFYWAHRFMHSSYRIFKLFHKVHHDSKNPTPFAMHSFAPLEAITLALYIPLILFLLPIHLYALMIWFSIEAVVNTLGHLGYEMFPLRFFRTKYGKWLNPPTHHNLHHQESRTGFSHYFNFWDYVIGTNHKEYDEILNREEQNDKAIIYK